MHAAALSGEPEGVMTNITANIENHGGTGVPDLTEAKLQPSFLIDAVEKRTPVDQISSLPSIFGTGELKRQIGFQLAVGMKTQPQNPVPAA